MSAQSLRAILAGVMFRESAPRRFHFNRKVIGAYLTVSILHGSRAASILPSWIRCVNTFSEIWYLRAASGRGR